MGRPSTYSPEFRDRAIELYRVSGKSFQALAGELAMPTTTLSKWVQQANIDAGSAPGISTEDRAEMAQLRRDVRRLEMENEILKKAAAFFARENVLPK